MARGDKQLSFRVEDTDLIKLFKAAAALEGRSQQEVLGDAMREYVERHGGRTIRLKHGARDEAKKKESEKEA